jgi:hypothetical protein
VEASGDGNPVSMARRQLPHSSLLVVVLTSRPPPIS